MKENQELIQTSTKQITKITFISGLTLLAHPKLLPTLNIFWLPNHWLYDLFYHYHKFLIKSVTYLTCFDV
ncbi:MAG: hypothetical protein ACJA2Y_001415 [Cycloclasticus pugetii]|jgi:hypothetical protein